MLKYVGGGGGQPENSNMVVFSDTSGNYIISTRIVIEETEVKHSGSYKCEPGAAPVASVNVHVLDGKYRGHYQLIS